MRAGENWKVQFPLLMRDIGGSVSSQGEHQFGLTGEASPNLWTISYCTALGLLGDGDVCTWLTLNVNTGLDMLLSGCALQDPGPSVAVCDQKQNGASMYRALYL